ncbi:MAG: hypothetical protein KAH48_00095 [Chlorobi bacterium]|nr:hypothetical protein [Chlorobiota bacterium]
MTEAGEFKKDNNAELIKVQDNCAGTLVKSMISQTCSYYLNAAAIFEIDNNYTETLAFKSDYHKNTFTQLYDFIAANYRFVNQAEPIDMFYDSDENLSKLEQAWIEYFEAEIKELNRDSNFVKNLVEAYCTEQADNSFYPHLDMQCKNAIREVLRTIALRYVDYPREGRRYGAIVAEVHDV